MNKVYFRFTFGSERNSRIGAPVNHALNLFNFVVYRLHPTTGARKLRISPITSRPHSLLPFLPFLSFHFHFHFHPFLRSLGKDDQRLAAPTRHQYALNTIFSLFVSPSFLLIFSYHFPVCQEQRRRAYPLLDDTALFLPPDSITT